MSKAHFFLIAGPNGAGKSTMTASIRKRYPDARVIDPDAIAKEMTGSFSTVDQAQVGAAKKALKLVRQCIDEEKSFIVESTISGSTYLKFAMLASQKNFKTTLIYLGLNDAQLSAARVRKRIGQGGHAVPIDDIIRRYPRSLSNLKSHILAFDVSHIYDNSIKYEWVADFHQGRYFEGSEQMPNWLSQHLPEQSEKVPFSIQSAAQSFDM